MSRKGQVQGVNKGNILNQAAFIAELFGVVIQSQQGVCHAAPHLAYCACAYFAL